MLRGVYLRRLSLVALMSVFVLACSTPGVEGSRGVEVGSTTAPGSPSPPTPVASGTAAPVATVLPAGSYRFTVGEAGVVTIRLADSGVAVETVDPHAGWVQQPDESAASGEVELRFVRPGEAELRSQPSGTTTAPWTPRSVKRPRRVAGRGRSLQATQAR